MSCVSTPSYAELHVTISWPITVAYRSWSYDNIKCMPLPLGKWSVVGRPKINRYPATLCSSLRCDLDLWPSKPFQQRLFTGGIFVASFIEICPLSTEISVEIRANIWNGWTTHNRCTDNGWTNGRMDDRKTSCLSKPIIIIIIISCLYYSQDIRSTNICRAGQQC